MSDKIKYLFTNETADGSLVFRSTVESFGLDHTTDKDIYSFYTEFSQRSYFDSGLLPVDGSGILSIRRALHHTQVAYQHAPGKYYINWADYEGQSSASKFYVAQPYRIVIIDFLNDNIYGARTFYSPVPITHAEAPLYHTNLPNINCRGYRGNGVGWICLYHTDDVSAYPFNERLIRALDRCSGTETYNDANMSETDGTRFYREFRPDQQFLWEPNSWESKTSQEGWEWTLDADLWIPVLVQDWDHQGQHDPAGQPLTFVDALFGDYQAYYTDTLIPKPVNAIARIDKQLDRKQLFNEFKMSYMRSLSSDAPLTSLDPFNASAQVRITMIDSPPPPTHQEEDEDDEPNMGYMECAECQHGEEYDENYGPGENWFHTDDNGPVCEDCIGEFYIGDEESGTYHHQESPHGKYLIGKYREQSHVCLGGCTTAHPRYSFENPSLNYDLENINDMVGQICLNTGDRFWGMVLSVAIDGSHFTFTAEDVQEINENILDFKQSLLNPSFLNALTQGTHTSAKTKLLLEGMCAGCVSEMFSDLNSFHVYYQKLEDLVLNGLCRLGEYTDLPTEYQNFIKQVMVDNGSTLAFFGH